MKNTTKKDNKQRKWWFTRRIFCRNVLLLLSVFVLAASCRKNSARLPQPPFSMDRLAHLYVKARLFEKASGSIEAKQDTIRFLLKRQHISTDSIQAILGYFKTYPQAWIPFYKKVEEFSRPKPPAWARKKNPAPK